MRADKSILSIVALATALAAGGDAIAQPVSRAAPGALWTLRPATPDPHITQWRSQAQEPGQGEEPGQGGEPGQGEEPGDDDAGSDNQTPDRQSPMQGQPDFDAHEGDPRDDGRHDLNNPEAQRQPGRPQDERRRQDDRHQDENLRQEDAPRQDRNQNQDQNLRQDRLQPPRGPDLDDDDEGQPDVQEAPDSDADDRGDQETANRTRQQRLITLYHEPAAPTALGMNGAQQTPRGDASDVTASIGPAPIIAITPQAGADMRPAAPAPAADSHVPPAFPAVSAPRVTDTADALLGSVIIDQARALLDRPATFAGSRLDAAQQVQLRNFYATRATPLWLANGQWLPAAKSAQARFEHAWEEGLEPADYPVPVLRDQNNATEILAAAEIAHSINAVKYARDASGGRLDLPRLSRNITPTLDLPAGADVLTSLAAAMSDNQDVGARLGDYNPRHTGYVALRNRLIELRAARPPEPPVARIPDGPDLQIGMRDPRVTLVRSRLGLTPSDDASYDESLAAAVAEFQRSRGLKPTGRLTRQTVVAMAGDGLPLAPDESALIVNMERWRWLPRALGPDYIFVNIPEYRMRVVRDGKLAHEARVVVGKAQTPTPLFSDRMQYAVINPYWNVPPSIMKKEFLPGLARDPNYAARRGYEVIRRGNTVHVRQPPGERNALGHIKFMFPNDHAVYLHDTPSRALFGKQTRAFSHGCVRVDDPMKFAELVLGPQWPASRIRKLIGRGERTVRLPAQIPIHLAYFTASIDAGGVLHAREDIYGIDRRMRAAIGQQRP